MRRRLQRLCVVVGSSGRHTAATASSARLRILQLRFCGLDEQRLCLWRVVQGAGLKKGHTKKLQKALARQRASDAKATAVGRAAEDARPQQAGEATAQVQAQARAGGFLPAPATGSLGGATPIPSTPRKDRRRQLDAQSVISAFATSQRSLEDKV